MSIMKREPPATPHRVARIYAARGQAVGQRGAMYHMSQ